MTKIGLVIEGGGMKCAYSAGILDRFLDENIHFDYVIGVSAGCANGLSYLAGQRNRNLRFYTDHIHEKDYFGMRPFLHSGNLFNLDYIYSDLTNSDGGDPLDYEKIMANPAEYELVATNAETGRAEYFPKEALVKDDYELVKASCCLPGACRPRFYNGHHYYDGGVTDAIPVDHALKKGCDKLVVILSKPRDYDKKPEKMRLFYTVDCIKYPRIVSLLNSRHIRYMKEFRKVFELEKEGKAMVFTPADMKMSTYGMDEKANQALYDLAVSDVDANLEQLLEFMKK